MAHEKRGWKDTLQAIQSERSRQDDRVDSREKKNKSKLMYRRRKLDKDVKRYYANARPIRSSEIERIGRQHGFYTRTAPERKDNLSQKDA